MNMHYYPDTDSLYIELQDTASVETREVAFGVNADFDHNGNIVGVDVDFAASQLNIITLR